MNQEGITTAPLSPAAVEGVKASLPKLSESGTEIVQTFYETLFSRYPSMKSQFNMDRQKGGKSAIAGVPAQVASLANFVLRFANNIDNITSFAPAIERVAHKHVSRSVQGEQYAAVADSFLHAMKCVLEDAATEQVMNAWEEVFAFLATTFTNTERSLREELSARAGYSGFVDMTVVKIIELGGRNRAIYLVPKNYPVPPYSPGQYVAIAVEDLQGESMMCTCKLDETEEEALRVTVRNSEEAASLFLLQRVLEGSILKVSMPCGKGK